MPVFKVLVVDDEPDIVEFIRYNLKKEGYDVFTAENGKMALKIAKEVIPHLVILDVMMPEMDGIEACEEMRKKPYLQDTIITFLTARGEDYSQIAGFEAGADDYLAKPIKPKVLVSRVKALLRRHKLFNDQSPSHSSPNVIKIGTLTIDRDKYVVTLNNEKLNLPRKEFELLVLLASDPERVFTRDEIYHKIWGDDIIVGDRTIDVHIRKLREKLGNSHFKTIKGVGYSFLADDEQ
jgi:two-component system, OmpR family, alkaline phosphatase synthesis response regulator PhoP